MSCMYTCMSINFCAQSLGDCPAQISKSNFAQAIVYDCLRVNKSAVSDHLSALRVSTVAVNKTFTFRFCSTIVVRCAQYKKYGSHVV